MKKLSILGVSHGMKNKKKVVKLQSFDFHFRFWVLDHLINNKRYNLISVNIQSLITNSKLIISKRKPPKDFII